MTAKIFKFPNSGARGEIPCFILNVWQRDQFWGSVGAYMVYDDALNDAKLIMNIPGFSKFRIEVVFFIPRS